MTVNQAVRGVFADSTDDVIRDATYRSSLFVTAGATSRRPYFATHLATYFATYDATHAATLDATRNAIFRSSQ